MPKYHPKFNRFKGFAFIESDDPTKLPWTTAKNGINRESDVFSKILPHMQNMTSQYTTHLSKVYPSEKEATIGIDGLGSLTTKPISVLDTEQVFRAPTLPATPTHTTISYKKKRSEVQALKKSMGHVSMSNPELGRRTFDYYKEMEGSDDG